VRGFYYITGKIDGFYSCINACTLHNDSMKRIITLSNEDLEHMIGSQYLYLIKNEYTGTFQIGKRVSHAPRPGTDPVFDINNTVVYPEQTIVQHNTHVS